MLFSYLPCFFSFFCLGFFTFFLPLVPICSPPVLFEYHCYVTPPLFSSRDSSFPALAPRIPALSCSESREFWIWARTRFWCIRG